MFITRKSDNRRVAHETIDQNRARRSNKHPTPQHGEVEVTLYEALNSPEESRHPERRGQFRNLGATDYWLKPTRPIFGDSNIGEW